MDGAQSVDQRLSARDEASQFVGAKLALARGEIDGSQKDEEVPLHQSCDDGVHDSENGDAGELSHGPDVLEDADHGFLSLVDPWTEAGVAPVVVGEFVREHGAKLRDGEN
jgi:hypothetical protein